MNYALCILSLLLSISAFADIASPNAPAPTAKEFTMPLNENKNERPRQIRLQIEIAETDIKDYALEQSTIVNEISTRLALAQIQIKDDPSLPKLVLRIKSIQADRAIATFVQMGFFEEATLKRNNNSIMALTWSQATLISGPKDEMIKEITQVVIGMCNSFILEYNKAFAK